jgi:hypothetical protein
VQDFATIHSITGHGMLENNQEHDIDLSKFGILLSIINLGINSEHIDPTSPN